MSEAKLPQPTLSADVVRGATSNRVRVRRPRRTGQPRRLQDGRPPGRVPFRVLCVSLYEADIAAADALVAELRRRGLTRMNRSRLIRAALAHLDLEAVIAGPPR